MRTIIGKLQDIQPNGESPRLELFFDPSDLVSLPSEHKGEITLIIHGASWKGTIGLTPGNKPYVHTFLGGSKGRTRCTDLFLSLELAERAELEFHVRERGVLELDRVLTTGEWRAGGNPAERSRRT